MPWDFAHHRRDDMQTPRSESPDRVSEAAPPWLGRWSFALALASAAMYFASSEGIRNFVASLFALARRVLGHGA